MSVNTVQNADAPTVELHRIVSILYYVALYHLNLFLFISFDEKMRSFSK